MFISGPRPVVVVGATRDLELPTFQENVCWDHCLSHQV